VAASLPPHGLEVANPTYAGQVAERRVLERNRGHYRWSETGGSDAHFLRFVGMAYTLFPGRSLDELRVSLEGATSQGWLVAPVRPSQVGPRALIRQQFRALVVSSAPVSPLRSTAETTPAAPVKIAQVSPYDFAYPGGANNHIYYLERELARLGHDTRIVAPASDPTVVERHPHLTIIGKPTSIPTGGSIARIALSVRLSKQVKALLDQEEFDVVHLHEPLMPMLPITFLRFSKSVNVGTFHAYHDRRRLPTQWYFYGRQILKRWFRRLHGRIAVSEPARQFVQQYLSGEYQIIPNGIDLERFATPRPPLAQYADGKTNLLFVGRWEPRKGLKYLIRAFALVHQEFPDTRLIVVGPDGGHRAAMAQSLMGMGLAANVELVGQVPDELLARYYQTADIFCYPATGSESMGIVLLEAMAAGKPLVASATQGAVHVVCDGSDGLLVPPKDHTAFAMALVHLLADRDLRQRMGAQGRENVQAYSWSRIAARIEAYYEELLASRRPEPAVQPAFSQIG
jgi:phosphatidylinositol alpha-mannosyltransferase